MLKNLFTFAGITLCLPALFGSAPVVGFVGVCIVTLGRLACGVVSMIEECRKDDRRVIRK